jgi:uncharacterized SAM-binding protein YcdF (DUF218 family)
VRLPKKIRIFVLVFFVGILGLLLFYKQCLTLYGRWYVVDNAQPGADAIICLSGDRETRTPQSLRLWKEKFAPKLYVTQEKPKNKEFNGLELSHLEFARAVTQRMNLDAKWQILPSQSGGATSTFDEAEDALNLAQKEGWQRIIIVTDEFHTRRSLLAFKKVFKASGIAVQVAGAPNEVFAVDDWWQSDRGILAYFGETIKYPIYLLWDHEPKIVKND